MRTQQPHHNTVGAADKAQASPANLSHAMTGDQSHSRLPSPSTPLSITHMQHLQRTIGNRAVSQMQANKNSSQQPVSISNSTAVIQTKQNEHSASSSSAPSGIVQMVSDNKDHHQLFLQQRAVGTGVDTSSEGYLLAEACAFILDHNSYKKMHSPLHLPPKYSAVAGKVPQTGNAQDYLNVVHGYILQELKQQTSKMQWDPLTPMGTGTGAHASYVKAGHAEGTPTSVNTPWMDILKKRRDGTKTLYVMGHLINADLGGPGLDYNYVPLPGRGGWYGANDANAIHSKGIEQIVKTKYSMLGESVTHLEYHVNAVYPRDGRTAQIDEIQHALVKMGEIEQSLAFKASVSLRMLKPDVKKELKTKIQSVANLESMLYAVSSNNYWIKSWDSLKGLLAENLKLWQLEDQLVPKQLNTLLKWEQHGMKEELLLTVPISLPDRVDAPYESSRSVDYKKAPEAKHTNQFQEYLYKNSQITQDSSGAALEAKVAAFLMDMNEYDREHVRDLIGNLMRLQELKATLTGGSLTDEQRGLIEREIESLSLANELLEDDPDIARIVESDAVVPIIAKQLEMKSGELFNKVQDYVKTDHQHRGTGKKFSSFSYSGQTPWGSPGKIVARLEKNGHPHGSSAGGDSEWMLKLEERRDASKTLYVRGHMLNRNLGGAGLDSNMVPLTGREGWYGANNANGLHSAMIEEKVKHLYSILAEQGQEHDPSKVTDLIYTVEAVFGDHARPQTAYIDKMVDNYEQNIIQAILQGLESSNSGLDDNSHKLKYTELSTRSFIGVAQENPKLAKEMFLIQLYNKNESKYGSGLNPLTEPLYSQIVSDFNLDKLNAQQLIEAWNKYISVYEYERVGKEVVSKQLAYHDFKTGFSIPIAALPAEHSKLIQQKISSFPYMKEVLDSLSPTGNYLTENVLSLQDKLRANRNLWKYEDTNVPLQLVTHVSWKHLGRTMSDGGIVPVVLPSVITAPYIEREKD